MESDAWSSVLTLANRAMVAAISIGVVSTTGTLIWWKRHRPLSREVWNSLATSIAGALPGLVFSVDACVRWFLHKTGMEVSTMYQSPTMVLSVLWVLVAPWLFGVSWAFRRKIEAPKGLWLVQASHAAVWIASAYLTFLAGVFV